MRYLEVGSEVGRRFGMAARVEGRRLGQVLTARRVATAPPGRHFDGGGTGLFLDVKTNGSRYWCQRLTIGGRRRELGLGTPAVVTLGRAREAALANLRLLREGADPLAAKRRAEAEARARLTFAEAAERLLADKAAGFGNAKHAAQWRATLATYALPVLGPLAVAEIRPADVLRALQPIWASKTETATRLRGRIEAVLAWATVAGFREGDNPARWKGNLDHMLPAPRKGAIAAADNQPALALGDAAQWWAALRQREGLAARALAFLALTAARSGEVRGMTWAELDLAAGIWTVPAARMKAKREHRVPLSAEALAVLRVLPRVAGCDLVFPGQRARPLSDMSLLAVMRRMQEAEEAAGRKGWLDPRSGRAAVPHGLRSTFRDWAAERGVERELAEICLAHSVGSEVERAYRRADMLERRRAVMGRWAGFLEGREGGEVVALGRNER
jgi:integrase